MTPRATALLRFSSHQQHDICLSEVGKIALIPNDLIVHDLKRVKEMEHSVAAIVEFGTALHHHDASRLKGADHFFNRDDGHRPAKQNQVEPLLAEIVLTISHDGDMEDQAQLLGSLLSDHDTHFGWVEPPDFPAQARQVEGISALAHSIVQCHEVRIPLDPYIYPVRYILA